MLLISLLLSHFGHNPMQIISRNIKGYLEFLWISKDKKHCKHLNNVKELLNFINDNYSNI